MKISIENKQPRLYSSRIIDTYIKLIKSKYSHVNIGGLLRYAGMELYEVADQGHWFTQDQVNRFYEKLVQLTGNENIAREAGRYAASPDAIGVMRQYALGMVSPGSVYKAIQNASPNFTRSTHYQSRVLKSNSVEITVTPHSGINELPFQCENRIGFLDAIAMIFQNRLPRIEHPECIFKGGKACRYIVSWEKTSTYLWKGWRNYAAIALGAGSLFFCFIDPWLVLTGILPGSAFIVLFLALLSEIGEKAELKASLDHLRDSTDRLVDQMNINYNNALMVNEIGRAVSAHTSPDDVLANIIQILGERLDYDRGMILLADKERSFLVYRAGFGYSNEQRELLDRTSFRLNREDSRGVFVVSFREQRPFLINDIEEIKDTLSLRSLAFARKLGSHSFICCPIVCDGESIGILVVDNLKSKRSLVQSDMSLLTGMAPIVGISIRNAELLDAKMRQFKSLLRALAATIDARDPLTAGHSERVTEYALGICGELGLSREDSEVIKVAALLHDYGKIGVPDAILKKKGKLTAEEYENLKTHTRKTRQILEQINFEGMLSQVPAIAGSHHEKLDGTGYPDGLSGDEIPIGARIIAVADFFEAVTAKRHYRDPMTLEEAIALLKEESVSRFDPKVVDALIRYYFRSRAGLRREALSV
jgi:hypothetical protein